MPIQLPSSGDKNLDTRLRRAVKALSEDGFVPSDSLVSKIYFFASMPESKYQYVCSFDSVGSHYFAGEEVLTAISRHDIALAIVPKDRAVVFNPSAIAELLCQDSDVRDHSSWESLVFHLLVYRFRVANITITGDKIDSDIHDISQGSSANALSDLDTPSKGKQSFLYSLAGILFLDLLPWLSNKEPTAWQIAALIGFALFLGLSLVLSGRSIGIRTIWTILIAGVAFLSFIAVLLVRNWI